MSCLNRFKGWCQENFPFIEDDFNAITDYQLMCKLKEYVVSIGNDVANLEIDYNELAGKIAELEEIVNSMDGEFDELVAEFNSLKVLVASYNMRIIANANRIEQVNTNLQQLISLNIDDVKGLINDLKDYVDREDTLILAEISTINNNIVLIRKDIEILAQGIPKVRDTGTIITLNDTIKDAPIDMKLDPSELSQDADPTPESPQDIHVISGDNSIKVCNKNLAFTGWAQDFVTRVNYSSSASITTKDSKNCLKCNANAGYGSYDTKYMFKINWEENTQYTFSFDIFCESTNGYASLCIEYTDGTITEILGVYDSWTHKEITSTSGKTIKYLRVYYRYGNSYIDINTFQVEKGTTATSYVAPQVQVKPLTLGDIEYCKIGNYSDYFFKAIDGDSIYDTLDSTTKASLTSGKWYMFKRLPYKVLNGNEGWALRNTSEKGTKTYSANSINDYVLEQSSLNPGGYALCDKFVVNRTVSGVGQMYSPSGLLDIIGISFYYNEKFSNDRYVYVNTTEDLPTYLASNNVKLYYKTINSQYIPLNDTLQQQLDDIYETLKAYDGQTNITQINHDLPFIITAITMKKGSVTDEV